MEEHQIGWIAAIIIGGIAGWLAEQFMKSQMGLVMNIVLGIIGAAVASWLLGFLGVSLGGWNRLSDCRLHWSLHPDSNRPRIQRWSSAANMNARRAHVMPMQRSR
jgi:uncharacterized membrane protein YeaQ/YmgE (transglycosylase-associated protein family)